MDLSAAKMELAAYRHNEAVVELGMEKVARLRAQAERMTPTYAAVTGGGGVSDRVGQAIARIDAEYKKFAAELAAIEREGGSIRATIMSLNGLDRRILTELYILGNTPKEVAEKLNCSYKYFYRLREAAIVAYAKKRGLKKGEKKDQKRTPM